MPLTLQWYHLIAITLFLVVKLALFKDLADARNQDDGIMQFDREYEVLHRANVYYFEVYHILLGGKSERRQSPGARTIILLSRPRPMCGGISEINIQRRNSQGARAACRRYCRSSRGNVLCVSQLCHSANPFQWASERGSTALRVTGNVPCAIARKKAG